MAACSTKPDRVDASGLAYAGSMLQIQLYVNDHPEVLSRAVADAIEGYSVEGIRWASPLQTDRYREYQDGAFLEKLELSQYRKALQSFWPSGGPCWDALGVAPTPNQSKLYILIEAKSYPDEAASSMGAKAESSISLINKSLSETAAFHRLESVPGKWIEGRYQAANRLAHLYFLAQICEVQAALVFVCFTDDPTHPETKQTSFEDWHIANPALWDDLGMKKKPQTRTSRISPDLNGRQRSAPSICRRQPS